jgi:hypothetical protein
MKGLPGNPVDLGGDALPNFAAFPIACLQQFLRSLQNDILGPITVPGPASLGIDLDRSVQTYVHGRLLSFILVVTETPAASDAHSIHASGVPGRRSTAPLDSTSDDREQLLGKSQTVYVLPC